MASRRSRRRKKKGNSGSRILIAALLLAAGGAGGWWYFGGFEAGTDDGAISEVLAGESGSGTSGAPAGLAQIESLLTEVSLRLSGSEGEAREKTLREGYHMLAPLLEGPLPVQERRHAIEVFHSITSELFLSPVHNEFSLNYIVKPGDRYDRIASKAGISTALLTDLNNRPRGHRLLHPNENLKLPKGTPHIVVRKRDFTASLYFGDYLVRQYLVAHGRNNNTPQGQTTIANMTIDPEKSARGPNDPVNEMRLRWIGFAPYVGQGSSRKRTGFGLHGTAYPESIPGMSSRGCVRMSDGDVIELYDIIRVGNRVEIRA